MTERLAQVWRSAWKPTAGEIRARGNYEQVVAQAEALVATVESGAAAKASGRLTVREARACRTMPAMGTFRAQSRLVKNQASGFL